MRTTVLGRTSVRVSALGFGAAPIGNLYAAIDDDTAAATVAAAWDGGVRYFDTAPHYGLGLSERRLGSALAGRPRGEFAVSTKVGRLLVPNPTPRGSDLANGFDIPDDLTRHRDYSRDGVLRSLEASLDRLGLDRVDIAFVHDPDEHLQQAIDQSVPTLIELRDQGVVGAIGAGMNVVDPLRRLVAETDLDVVMVAGRWTLLDRSARPLLDECQARGVAVVAAAPFNSGLLARPWPADDATYDYGRVPDPVLAQARALATTCERWAAALPQAALQFGLRDGGVASVVAGIRTVEEATSDIQWMNDPVPEKLWPDLEQAWASA